MVTVLVRRINLAALHGLLEQRRMSLRELSQLTGISWSHTKYLANGERNPSEATAQRLAEVLGVPPARFITVTRVDRSRPSFRPRRAA